MSLLLILRQKELQTAAGSHGLLLPLCLCSWNVSQVRRQEEEGDLSRVEVKSIFIYGWEKNQS